MTAGRASAVADLERHALLWLVGQGDFEPVVRSACDLLVQGLDGEALVNLAGLSVHEDRWASGLDEAVTAALMEQARALPARDTDEAQVAVVRALGAEALAGRLHPRDLAAWAHRHIGHTGADLAQPLVDLDDRYDLAEYDEVPLNGLDSQVLAFCRELAEHQR